MNITPTDSNSSSSCYKSSETSCRQEPDTHLPSNCSLSDKDKRTCSCFRISPKTMLGVKLFFSLLLVALIVFCIVNKSMKRAVVSAWNYLSKHKEFSEPIGAIGVIGMIGVIARRFLMKKPEGEALEQHKSYFNAKYGGQHGDL